MTDDELKAIEARANAATPGPWRVEDGHSQLFAGDATINYDFVYCMRDDEERGVDAKANSAFVVASRMDVPALIAEVRRLQEEVRRLQEPFEATCPVCDYEVTLVPPRTTP